MSHIPFTLLSYFLNAIAVSVDKFMLSEDIPNPLVYVFYISAFSAVVLFALPFTHIPTLLVFLLASISTILWTTGTYFMFKALRVGLMSRVIPMINTISPMILLASALVLGAITTLQVLAVILLILGLVFLTFMDWKGRIKKSEIIFILLAAIFIAVSYIVLKQAYLQADFLTVFVWSRMILIPVGLAILIIPKLRHIIFSSHTNRPAFNLISKVGILFIAGQAAGGLSELLLTFSISLANPALVNSLQGTQYAFLFIFSLFLSKRYPSVFTEKFTVKTIGSKTLGIILLGVGLFILAFNLT